MYPSFVVIDSLCLWFSLKGHIPRGRIRQYKGMVWSGTRAMTRYTRNDSLKDVTFCLFEVKTAETISDHQ
jgi:hypothetical protein